MHPQCVRLKSWCETAKRLGLGCGVVSPPRGGARHPSGCTGPRQGRKNIRKSAERSLFRKFRRFCVFIKIGVLTGAGKILRKEKNRPQLINKNRNRTILHNFFWSIRPGGSRWKRFCRFRAPDGRTDQKPPICKRPIASRFPVQANYS